MPDLSWTTIAIATITMYVAESYAAVIGGGSFLVQPILIALGLPPAMAIANDVTAAAATALGGLQTFRKERNLIRWQLGLTLLPTAFIGVWLGVWLLPNLPTFWLEKILGIVALLATLFLLFSRYDGLHTRPMPHYFRMLCLPLGFVIGFYAGISGAGLGILAGILLVTVFGLNHLQALATRKIIFVAIFLLAGVGYFLQGLLIWQLLLPMSAASWLAGRTSSLLALQLGNLWLKRIFTVVIGALAVWLLLK